MYQEKKLYNDALNNFHNILSIAEEINNYYWKAQALSSIGNIYLINNKIVLCINFTAKTRFPLYAISPDSIHKKKEKNLEK